MASSSSSSPPTKPYEVFISFRGEDTHHNFVSHLYAAFKDGGIRTYIYGVTLTMSTELMKAIHDSSIAIVVLSTNYASSTWCLDELAKIIECKHEFDLVVFPIFYHVDPSDFRNQKNRFGEALSKHEENLKDGGKKVKIWRDALTEVANLEGVHITGEENEAKCIKEIVEKTYRQLLEKAYLYEVFISLRGKDTRNNFVSHLYSALKGRGIRTYLDEDGLKNGQNLITELMKAIEESRRAIVVLSTNYASSDSCLDELVKIIECNHHRTLKDESDVFVVPIFYHVNPSHIRNQEKSFGEGFSKAIQKYGPEKEMIWRDALTKVANMKGMHITRKENEAECKEKIVEQIYSRLPKNALSSAESMSQREELSRKLRVLISTLTEFWSLRVPPS